MLCFCHYYFLNAISCVVLFAAYKFYSLQKLWKTHLFYGTSGLDAVFCVSRAVIKSFLLQLLNKTHIKRGGIVRNWFKLWCPLVEHRKKYMAKQYQHYFSLYSYISACGCTPCNSYIINSWIESDYNTQYTMWLG